MRARSLNTLRRFALLAVLVGLLGTFADSPAFGSIAILQEPMPDPFIPEIDDDAEPVPEVDIPEIDPPNPGPGDDTPDPEPEPWAPWDVVVDRLVPGLVEIVTTPIGSDEDDEDGPGFNWTIERADFVRDISVLVDRERPGRDDRECDRDDCDRDHPHDHDDDGKDDGDDDGKDDGDDDGKDDGEDDGDTTSSGNNGADADNDGSSSANASRWGFDGGSLRWQTVDVQRGPQGVRWLARAELRFALPDMRFGARFRMRVQIVGGSVTFDIDSVRLRREFLRGDVSGDETLGMDDGIQILERLFDRAGTGDAPFCASAADANDDGLVDISDVMTVFDHLYLGGRPLAAPFAESGHDETITDDLDCPLELVGSTVMNDNYFFPQRRLELPV